MSLREKALQAMSSHHHYVAVVYPGSVKPGDAVSVPLPRNAPGSPRGAARPRHPAHGRVETSCFLNRQWTKGKSRCPGVPCPSPRPPGAPRNSPALTHFPPLFSFGKGLNVLPTTGNGDFSICGKLFFVSTFFPLPPAPHPRPLWPSAGFDPGNIRIPPMR